MLHREQLRGPSVTGGLIGDVLSEAAWQKYCHKPAFINFDFYTINRVFLGPMGGHSFALQADPLLIRREREHWKNIAIVATPGGPSFLSVEAASRCNPPLSFDLT